MKIDYIERKGQLQSLRQFSSSAADRLLAFLAQSRAALPSDSKLGRCDKAKLAPRLSSGPFSSYLFPSYHLSILLAVRLRVNVPPFFCAFCIPQYPVPLLFFSPRAFFSAVVARVSCLLILSFSHFSFLGSLLRRQSRLPPLH